MTIDEQIRSIVREEIKPTVPSNDDKPWRSLCALFLIVICAIGVQILDASQFKKRLERLESRSSEITVVHPDRRLERVVEPWGGGL